MTKQMEYTAEHVETKEGMAHIREYPGMYIGSVTENGLHHILKEIVSNSIDEFINGSGDRIEITVQEDGAVTIKDNGRGIPKGTHSSGCSVIQAVFGIMNTGGKYTKDGQTGYNTSGGQHGVGGKATNATSKKFIAMSWRDGILDTVEFERGVFISHKQESTDRVGSGTEITFYPDEEIFETIDFNFDRICKQSQEFSFLSPGLEFCQRDLRGKEPKEVAYLSDNGLFDYVKFLSSGKELVTEVFQCSTMEGTSGVDVAMAYNTSYADTVKLYTNNIPNLTGTHLTGFRTALTRAINEFAKDKKLLKANDGNLSGDDLKEGQVLVINLKMLKPVYQGQNKEILSSSEGRTITEQLVAKEIRVWLEANPQAGKTIVDKALAARRAREAAKKAREASRKKTATITTTILPGKLADCISKLASDTELYIVEGDSAGGTAKDARDRHTQAILSLRGKVLSILKHSFAKIIANKEVHALFTAMGLEIGQNKVIINEEKLRYHKVIIMTDGDVDGSHIRVLLLTLLWVHARELVEKGYVYVAMPPLYKVTRNRTSEYLIDDAALREYRKMHPGAKLEVQRFKGLTIN